MEIKSSKGLQRSLTNIKLRIGAIILGGEHFIFDSQHNLGAKC